MSELILNRKPRMIRSLTKEHRQKISLAHKGKKKNYSFANRKKTIINPIWVKKPVICVNTGQVYESIIKGAEEFYNNKQSANEISEVCRGIKTYYKKDIWRFEKDFLALSDTQRQDLKNKCFELNKLFIKYRTKLLYKGITYDSFANLGLILHTDGLLYYKNNTPNELSSLLSAMISAAKRKNCPFIILKDEYIFFSEYEVLCKDSRGAFKLSEKPVNKSVQEVHDYYIKLLNKNIGDIEIIDLLQSNKNSFYKLDNMYFKTESNIKNYAYDNKIDKATLISLIDDPNYKFLFDKDSYNLDNTTKNKFYIKNNHIFLNKEDYINRFIKLLTKEDVLKELNLIV